MYQCTEATTTILILNPEWNNIMAGSAAVIRHRETESGNTEMRLDSYWQRNNKPVPDPPHDCLVGWRAIIKYMQRHLKISFILS